MRVCDSSGRLRPLPLALPVALLIVTLPIAGFAAEGDYPCWRGADGSGGIETQAELVNGWDEARLLWSSQARNPLPNGWGSRVIRPRETNGKGGFACPVVVGDRLYVPTYEPTGPLAKTFWGRVREDSPEVCRRIAADEVLYCIDADTGRTIWRAAFEGLGINKAGGETAGHYNPCVADGRVYWVGTLGRLFCVHAETGEKLWHVSTGGDSDYAYRYLRYCLEMEKLGGRGPNDRSFKRWKPDPDEPLRPEELLGSRGWGWDSIPQVADGVVVVNSQHGDAVGFDARTGRELWRHKDITMTTRPLVIWRHNDKARFIGVNKTITCIEPQSGEILWTTPGSRSASYGGHTPAIAGDLLICPTAETDPKKDGGFGCFWLTESGAERRWALPELFKVSWNTPLIHRGRVWLTNGDVDRGYRQEHFDLLQQRWPQVFTDDMCREVRERRYMIISVDLATGEVLSAVNEGGLADSSMVGLGSRIIMHEGYGLGMIDADTGQYLGWLGIPTVICVSPTVANGRLYMRGADAMINCWELRRNPPGRTNNAPADLGNATLVVELQGLRINDPELKMCWRGTANTSPAGGTDLRLHLRTEDGDVVQAWVTYPPAHNVPEWAWPRSLKLKDDRLAGDIDLHVLGRDYPLSLNLRITAQSFTGAWHDRARAQPMQGTISGEIAPMASKRGRAKMRLRREWCGGQNFSHETSLTFDLKDGRMVAPELKAKAGEDAWLATFKEFDGKLIDDRLQADFTVELDSRSIMPSGTYRVKFDVPVVNNRPHGEYRAWRDGKECTPKSEVNRQVWGVIEIPEDEPADPLNALHDIILDNALPRGKDLRISVTVQNGNVVASSSRAPHFCRSSHDVDFSQVRITPTRMKGPVEVIIRSDGYVPKHDLRCRYELDIQPQGRSMQGSFTGLYEVRQPRDGTATGIIRAE